MYRSRHFDVRTHEEKILEECTFQPKINGPSPFVSEKTLRKHAQTIRKPPPPPPNPNPTMSTPLKKSPKLRKKKTESTAPLGGMYTKANGLIRGPPQIIGLPMYYFDPFNPPNFQEGTYGAPMKTVTIEEVEVEEVMAPPPSAPKQQLLPPPLPPFLDPNYKKPEAPTAAKKLVIVKGPKKEVKEEVSGWQAVLAEMQAKKEKKMNKVVKEEKPAVVTPKPQGKGKKSGKDFKDVMDELNYKLAVLRGGIVARCIVPTANIMLIYRHC